MGMHRRESTTKANNFLPKVDTPLKVIKNSNEKLWNSERKEKSDARYDLRLCQGLQSAQKFPKNR